MPTSCQLHSKNHSFYSFPIPGPMDTFWLFQIGKKWKGVPVFNKRWIHVSTIFFRIKNYWTWFTMVSKPWCSPRTLCIALQHRCCTWILREAFLTLRLPLYPCRIISMSGGKTSSDWIEFGFDNYFWFSTYQINLILKI